MSEIGVIGAIILAGLALLTAIVLLLPGGIVQTYMARGGVVGTHGPAPMGEPYIAPTATPTIEDERMRREVVELASQSASREFIDGINRLVEQMEAAGIDPVWRPNGRLKLAAEGHHVEVRVYELIHGYFNNGEVEELRFALGIREGEVSGVSKAERVIRLIEYCEHRGRLGQLVALCRARRPQLDWPSVGLDK